MIAKSYQWLRRWRRGSPPKYRSPMFAIVQNIK
jgi:hypothetical protein